MIDERLKQGTIEVKARTIEKRISKMGYQLVPLFFIGTLALIMMGGGDTWTVVGALIIIIMVIPLINLVKDFIHQYNAMLMYKTLAGWMGDKDAIIDPVDGRIKTQSKIEALGHYKENQEVMTSWKPSIWQPEEFEYTPFDEDTEKINLEVPSCQNGSHTA